MFRNRIVRSPKRSGFLSSAARLLGAVALLAVAAACGFLALAAWEVPPDTRPAFWVVYGIVGGASVAGAAWLLLRQRAGGSGVYR